MIEMSWWFHKCRDFDWGRGKEILGGCSYIQMHYVKREGQRNLKRGTESGKEEKNGIKKKEDIHM